MAGLLDIAPLRETVVVRGAEISVSGLSAEGIGLLLFRFPELGEMITRRKLDLDALLQVCPRAIAPIIACGAGFPGNPEHEAAAGALVLDEQALLMRPILAFTMPRGFGPFVETVLAIAATLSGGAAERARGTRSPKPSKS